MITEISISNYKSISDMTLIFKNLNLLVGCNSSGKSSIIQSILLASKSILEDYNSPLNGSLINVGEFTEARNYITNAKQIDLSIKSFNHEYEISITSDDDFCKLIKNKKDSDVIELLDPKKQRLSYISAHRIGAMNLYPKNYSNNSFLEYLGEFAINAFESNKDKPLREELVKDQLSKTLSSQVNYWLKYIINTELKTKEIKNSDNIKAMFSNSNNRFVRPKNIGTGTIFLVSIIINCLTSKKNSTIIIENPEIHLHPKAQSFLTDFFIFVANSGIQLIIETHSDHIFNAIRRNIFKSNISNEKVSINFLSLNNIRGLSENNKIEIDSKGVVINHHEDLFDQFNNDLDIMLGL